MRTLKKKSKVSYICASCSKINSKWSGICPDCGGIGTLDELDEDDYLGGLNINAKILELEPINSPTILEPARRIKTGMGEFDSLLGGGIVPGSVILLGGDPGIGKSTIMLQICDLLSRIGVGAVYVSGEESVAQTRMRAQRLGMSQSGTLLLAATDTENIIASVRAQKNLGLLIVDSIQTMKSGFVDASPGSIPQIKLCTHEFVNMSKSQSITTILVGHINKDGAIAGPKFLEHMVDVVLYFEGEQHYRILRSVKNRFGPAGEIAVFEMKHTGLHEVSNPSAFFLSNYNRNVSGSAIFSGIEGSRPLLTEVQALVSPSYQPMPKRAVVGWDANRLSMILAVLASRCKIFMGDKEVYLNIVGGLRIAEPAADLAVAAALISVFEHKTLPSKSIIFGEIGLTGEIRRAPNAELRIKEAQKLGFEVVIMPDQEISEEDTRGLRIIKLRYLIDLGKIF